MIDVSKAIEIFKENVPNKKITVISDWNGKYMFESRDEKLKDDELNYDSSIEVVDKKTGEFSKTGVFDIGYENYIDYLNNAKTLKTFN